MKYIDAEKLIAEIKGKIAEIETEPAPVDRETILLQVCKTNAFREVLRVINRLKKNSLQQERLPLPSNLDEVEFEYAQSLDEIPANQEEEKMIYDAFKAGAEWMAGQMKKEQPEVDLEKASRNVYESWMGGTMDDIRRDMVELGKVLNARKEEESK